MPDAWLYYLYAFFRIRYVYFFFCETDKNSATYFIFNFVLTYYFIVVRWKFNWTQVLSDTKSLIILSILYGLESSAGWTPSGCCSRRECGHPTAACPQTLLSWIKEEYRKYQTLLYCLPAKIKRGIPSLSWIFCFYSRCRWSQSRVDKKPLFS